MREQRVRRAARFGVGLALAALLVGLAPGLSARADDGWASLRVMPDPSAAVAAAVPVGAEVLVGESARDAESRPWFRVTLVSDASAQGWLSADEINFGATTRVRPPMTTTVANTGGDGLWLRAAPAADAATLVLLPEGARVSIVGAPTRDADGREWAPVDFQGQAGYAANDYLSVALDKTPAPHVATSSRSLAYFYKPPTDGTSPQTLATTAGVVVLSRGDEGYRDELRAAGYTGLTLEYIVSGEVEGPGPYADASAPCDTSYVPNRNNVAYGVGDFCAFINPNEDWFLHNGQGQRLTQNFGGRIYYQMNPGNSGWREFARARVAAMFAVGGWDGVFLDNVALSLYKAQAQLDTSDGTVAEYASDDAFRAAWGDYLALLSSTIRPAGQLWANLIADPTPGSGWDAYLPYLDGAMRESFATGYSDLTPEQWNANLTQAETALAQGKGVIGVAQGDPSDIDAMRFALASHLLITDGQRAFFRYASNRAYRQLWRYPEYDEAARLGAPLGPRYQQMDGLWRRDFACGSVVVDPATTTAQITVSGCP